MCYLHAFIERRLDTWVEFLEQLHVSASQLLVSYFVGTSNGAMSEDSWEDESGTRPGQAVRSKRAYLHDLEWIQPECHGFESHTCSLGIDRTSLLEELDLCHHREVPLLREMMSRLPEELISKILAETAMNNTNGVVNLNTSNDLQRISAGILSDRISEATLYRPLL